LSNGNQLSTSKQDEEFGHSNSVTSTKSDIGEVKPSTDEEKPKNDFDFRVPSVLPMWFSKTVKTPQSLQPFSSSSDKLSSNDSGQVLEESKSTSPQGSGVGFS